MISPQILEIAERIRTQDGAGTADPIFTVREERRIYGATNQTAGGFEWIQYQDGIPAAIKDPQSAQEAAKYEEADDIALEGFHTEHIPVVFFLTREAAENYVDQMQHRHHGKLSLYVASAYHSQEIILVRAFLASLKAPPEPTPVTDRGRRLMLDIETLGTKPGCVILSIGIIDIDDHSQYAHWFLDGESQIEAGATIDLSTLRWWSAKENLPQWPKVITPQSQVHPNIAISEFMVFLRKIGPVDEVWCKGPSFDFPILENLFSRPLFGCNGLPFEYFKQRDFRTRLRIAQDQGFQAPEPPKEAHNALVDARHQAETLISIEQWEASK